MMLYSDTGSEIKKNYLERLQEYDSNRINLQINIQNNLLNPKISKLPKYEFLD